METSTANEKVITEPPKLSRESSINFWKIWGATSFSNLGDGLYQLTLPLLAAQLTRSPSLIATLGVMSSLPWLIFALQAGSIVDRSDRRKIMLWVNGGRLLILFLLTLAIMMGYASLPMLYIAALLLGIGETLVDTALTSIVPSVVSKDRLTWANARLTAAQTVTNTFIGPPLAGYLAGLGFALATGSSTLMYVAAGFALLLIRGSFHASVLKTAQTKRGGWDHITEGLRFLWKNRLIRDLTLFTASMNLFWSGWGALIVLYAVSPGPMGLSEFEYGIFLTAMAIGGLLGSVVSERLQKWLGTRNTLALDFVGTILLLGVPALTTNPFAVGAAAFFAGMGATVWVILVASIRQQLVPVELLGRVYSASRFVSWGIGPIGALLAGLIAELWGIRAMFAIGGIASLGLLVLFLILILPQTMEALEAGERV
ncbi:MAG TPA: MFS transporter [Anaerolineales bacterium]|nr:MFS transporter [Anaerolineales bacterium]